MMRILDLWRSTRGDFDTTPEAVAPCVMLETSGVLIAASYDAFLRKEEIVGVLETSELFRTFLINIQPHIEQKGESDFDIRDSVVFHPLPGVEIAILFRLSRTTASHWLLSPRQQWKFHAVSVAHVAKGHTQTLESLLELSDDIYTAPITHVNLRRGRAGPG
jgi:hypothetical protein